MVITNSKKISSLKHLLNPLFEALKKESLSYCVCGNYEDLPEYTTHDVDIWVEDSKKAENLLYDIAKQKGFRIHLIYRTGVGSDNFLHIETDGGNPEFVRIDLMEQCAWRSVFPLVPGAMVEKKRRRFRNFYVPDPPVEASMQLLYPLISGGKIKDKYKEPIFTWRHHPTFNSILNRAIGRKHTKQLTEQIDAKDWLAIERNVWRLRLSVMKRSIFINMNFKFILTFLRAFKEYIAKFIRPKGVFLAFLGPDGCGKSTLCENICRVLRDGFLPGKVKIFYWRPMFLPRIRQLLPIFGIKLSDEDSAGTGQNRLMPDNLIISTVKFIYYWLDFVIGCVKFYSVWAKGGIVCFDRYYHDFFVNPQRFRLNLPSWIARAFMPLVPKPDVLFYLHAHPQVLISRKQEISIKELERQLNSYDSLLSSFPNAHKIDVTKSLDEVIREVASIVLQVRVERERDTIEVENLFTAWKYLTPQTSGKSLILVIGEASGGHKLKITPPDDQALVIHFDKGSDTQGQDYCTIGLPSYSVGVACVLCDTALSLGSVLIKELHRVINNGGGICFFISKKGYFRTFRRFLELHDFEFIQAYAVLPKFRNPRWIIPLCPRFLVSSAKGVFRPTKPLKRLLWKWVVRLSYLRFFPLVMPDRLIVAKKKGSAAKTKRPGLKELMENLLEKKDLEIALLTRPQRYSQKTTAQMMDQKGRILAYAKIGTTAQAQRLLNNEATTLKKLEQLNLQTVDIPQLIYIGEIEQDTVLVQPAKYPLRPGPVRLSDKHISFLAEIFNKTAKRWTFEKSPLFLSLQEGAQGLNAADYDGWSALLQAALRKICQRYAWQEIRLALAHRDFAPWNTCLNQKGQLVVFDWELACNGAAPLLDFYNFIIHSEAFLRHKKGDEILRMLLNEKGAYFELLTEYKTAIGGDSLFDHIALLMIYLHRTSTFYLNYRSLQAQAGFDTERPIEQLLTILWTMLDKLLKLGKV